MKIFEWPRDRQKVEKFLHAPEEASEDVMADVSKIIRTVRRQGDRAVRRFTKKFDGADLADSNLIVPKRELRKAAKSIAPELKQALKVAAERIRAFHERQRLKGWSYRDPKLGRIEMRVEPLERVGVYAPGGKAAYPSTVLMDVVPAKVAGVKQVVLATPPGPDGLPSVQTMAAAHIAGADMVLRIGGAQAIAAMAYGTESIPRVDKIVGPGNIYVATAKRLVFGQVDIDMIAGPTEVLIIADEAARLDWVAADLLAQAEHDEDASSIAILVGARPDRARALKREVLRQLDRLPRREVAGASIRRNGAIICVRNEKQAIDLTNAKAPEHVEVLTGNAREVAAKIRNAGAIFIGPYTPEPVGDYIAGPNHTLPTGGTARFSSPLSVWSFYKTLHTVEASRSGLERFAPTIRTLAEAEGLDAHARSALSRFDPEPGKSPKK